MLLPAVTNECAPVGLIDLPRGWPILMGWSGPRATERLPVFSRIWAGGQEPASHPSGHRGVGVEMWGRLTWRFGLTFLPDVYSWHCHTSDAGLRTRGATEIHVLQVGLPPFPTDWCAGTNFSNLPNHKALAELWYQCHNDKMYTWTWLHKILAKTQTYTADSWNVCNWWMQKIVQCNPDIWFHFSVSRFMDDSHHICQTMFTSRLCHLSTAKKGGVSHSKEHSHTIVHWGVTSFQNWQNMNANMNKIFYDNENKHKRNNFTKVFSMNDSTKYEFIKWTWIKWNIITVGKPKIKKIYDLCKDIDLGTRKRS